MSAARTDEGLSWRFEHDQQGDEPAEGGAAQARHRIVFFDSQAALWRVATNAVSISSWDPMQLVAPAAEQLSS